jgi:hypothetical protein
LETTSKDNGHTTRSVHAKAHGLLRGLITVIDILPTALVLATFSVSVQAAMNARLNSLSPFRIAPRFHLFEDIEPQAMHDQLLRCISTGSHG